MEPPQGMGVVASDGIVEAGFSVAFFAGEFVVVAGRIVGGNVGLGSIRAIVDVFEDIAGGIGQDPRRIKMVGHVIFDVARGRSIAARQPSAIEEDILVKLAVGGGGAPCSVGLVERVDACSVPIQLIEGWAGARHVFFDALAVAVVKVVHAGGRCQFVFGIVSVCGRRRRTGRGCL
ncbi:MAG: hypothetical protein WBF35_06095 [Candidatus Acidiferrales bacterium]